MIRVDAAEWRSTIAGFHGSGCTLFGFLTGVDRGDSVEIIGRVAHPESIEAHLISTTIPAGGTLPSLNDLYLGASWHERETGEMFGITFAGLTDARPLLRRAQQGSPPLLKSSVLVARVVREWPGAAEASDDGRRGGNPSRRRQRPPGVPEGFMQDEADGRSAIGGT